MPKVRILKDSEVRMLTAIYKAGNKVTTQNRPKGVSPQDLTRLFGAKLVARTTVPNPNPGHLKTIFAHSVAPEYLPQLGIEAGSSAPAPTETPAAQPKDRREALEAKMREAEATIAETRRELLELKAEEAVPRLLELAVALTPDEFVLALQKASQRDPEFDRKVDRFLATESPQKTGTMAVQETATAHTATMEARA